MEQGPEAESSSGGEEVFNHWTLSWSSCII
jgi:hypothetical protein